MKDETFEKNIDDIQEGDYVIIRLNKKFLIKQVEDKQKMLAEAMAAQKGGKKGQMGPAAPAQRGSTPTLPGLPANYKIDPPSLVVGKVSECLMSLVYLVDAYEERSKEPLKKGYENREIEKITVISKEQYSTSVSSILGES